MTVELINLYKNINIVVIEALIFLSFRFPFGFDKIEIDLKSSNQPFFLQKHFF